jgi:phosphatidylinositol glycan class B
VLLSDPKANTFAEAGHNKSTDYDDAETFVAFLMPCHSTPWRSKLFYPGLRAWALTCEPPLDVRPRSLALLLHPFPILTPAKLSPTSPERAAYRDEADRFYDDPVGFLKQEVGGRERAWPRYVVGFEGIETPLREYYSSVWSKGVVREKWRARNSHWHDDERRQGDVVVWEFGDGSAVEAKEDYIEMRPGLMA